MRADGPFARLARPVLFRLDAETAHGLAIRGLASGCVRGGRIPRDGRLRVERLGLSFANPLGLAAGFDKNAEVVDPVLALGFGFTEVGTVTPRAQPGNPRPRIFRLPADEAVINRLGFNNEGHEAAAGRLSARRGRAGIVGVNVGANKDSADRPADYAAGIARFAGLASYFTVNVSSPNTPGLRDLQARDALDDLLARAIAARDAAAATSGRRVPVLLKIAPDLDAGELDDVATVGAARAVDGYVVSNTTLSRKGLTDRAAGEAGGLSGRPLFARSTAVLAGMRARIGPTPVLVGVGGVFDGDDAFAKVAAGADLVQVYTGFVYGGPGTPARILAGLLARMDAEGVKDLSALRDRDVARLVDG